MVRDSNTRCPHCSDPLRMPATRVPPPHRASIQHPPGAPMHTTKTIHRSVATRATIPAATELRVVIRAVAQPIPYRIVCGKISTQKHREKHVKTGYENQGHDGRSEGCEGNRRRPANRRSTGRRAVPDSDTAPGMATEESTHATSPPGCRDGGLRREPRAKRKAHNPMMKPRPGSELQTGAHPPG